MAPKRAQIREIGPSESELLSIGKLQFLASFCPVHRHMPAFALARVFYPAINQGCVRFFENESGKTAAALIWARLSADVSNHMLAHRVPPKEADWVSGDTLWFLDLLAPFGQGQEIARTIARNPPEEPFCFARLDASGQVRRVVRGDIRQKMGHRMTFSPGLSVQG